ncbi:MerR family transcriptional regulator [Aquimarina rhabdastrellae]
MSKISTSFSIKDLENLSGIKAHTIRIWEKRYGLLEPERTDTNIRYYSLESFQKLLNITQLYNSGYKISKIAKLNQKEIKEECNKITHKEAQSHNAVNIFKMAMFKFNKQLFIEAFEELLREYSFEEVFEQFCIPFLNEIGRLWQTDFLTPAHEHFITSLIRDRIIIQANRLNTENNISSDTAYILFLPENEIHELGLIYANYLIQARGNYSIYLGQNIPKQDLYYLKEQFNNIKFVTYFTVEPKDHKIKSYINDMIDSKLIDSDAELWVLGRKYALVDTEIEHKQIKVFKAISDFLEALDDKKERNIT